MRKIVAAIIAGCVVAGGGAWYAFSYLPAQIQNEIDTAIASLAPRVLVEYSSVSIDIFKRRAIFSDVTVREGDGVKSGKTRQMTVSSGDIQDTFDVLLEDASATASKNPADTFLASTVHLTGLSVEPAPDQSADDDLAFLKRIKLGKLTTGRITDVENKLKIGRAALDGLSGARFSRAVITGIYGKEEAKKIEFSTARISAEEIDIHQIATLPKTFRGQRDWTKLSTGKISIERIRLKLAKGVMSVAKTYSDGIDAGRIIRFRMADAKMNGVSKTKKPFAVELGKFEINNFPIISDFPTNLEELRSFRTQHKNLIYDGFDIRGLKIKGPEGSFEVHNATVPKPVFRNTPSGALYAAKAKMSMDFRGDFGGFENSGKLPNPIIAEIFKNLKGRVIMTARSTADHEKKTGTIEAMEIAVPGVARLKLTGNVGNLPLRYYEAPNDPVVQQIALRQATLGALNITLVNEGLAEALLEAGAGRNRTTPSEFAQNLANMVRATVTADGSPEGLAIATEIGAFLEDPRSIHLALKPARPLPLMALGNPQLLQSVGQVSRILGLKLEANKAAQ